MVVLSVAVTAGNDDDAVFSDSTRKLVDGPSPKRATFLKTALLSAIVPGAGQWYTGHYIKGGAFLATEITTASIARFWYTTTEERLAASRQQRLLLTEAHSKVDSLLVKESVALMRYDAKNARYGMYNALSWMVGAYVYNVADALKSTGMFDNSDERSAMKAAWLSAVPGLGLGQIYNGEISKAGMVIMTQVSLGVVAFNAHRAMNNALDHYNASFEYTDSTGGNPVADKYKENWKSRQDHASRNRSSYLWYSLFFYFYSMLDAVVDAHLHDYEKKMDVYPDLIPETGVVGLKMDYSF